MLFKDLKIRTALLLSCLSVILLIFIFGCVAYIQTNLLWNDIDNLHNYSFRSNITVRDIKANIYAIHRTMKDITLSQNSEEMQMYINLVDIYERENYKLFEIVYESYTGDIAVVDSAYNSFRNWKSFRDVTIDLCKNGEFEKAAERTRKGGQDIVDDLMNDVDELIKFAMFRAASFVESAERGKNYMHIYLLITFITLIIILIIIFRLLTKKIDDPISELVDVVNKQSQGDLSVRCSIKSTNEFGQLSSAFNNMAESIATEINLKNNISDISNAMFGKDKIEHFVKDLLNALISVTEANNCALYFLNHNKTEFKHYYSVGLSRENIKSFSADINEGEFGLALANKTISKITDIPDNTVFTFSTVSGDIKPKEIITIPLIYQDNEIAVISLSTIKFFSDTSVKLLDMVHNELAVGINSILNFEKIKNYSEKLDEQNKELEAQRQELVRQQDEMKEQNAELEMQKKQISKANKLKSEFLSNMSHELRTPLNSVIALSGVLNKKLENQIPEKEYSYLEIIERNGKHLLSLINDILDLSRIEAGKEKIYVTDVSIQDLISLNIDNLDSTAKEKGIIIKNNINSKLPFVKTDNDKLYHIFQNIISNSVKFTDKGSVVISSATIDNAIQVSITDTGIGIPEDQLPYIFEEFKQVDGSDSKKYGGTGLGLAIVKKYCNLLNIKIKIESVLNKGSVFTLTIPLEPIQEYEQAINHTFKSNNHNLKFDIIPNLSDKSFLIIEDNEAAIIQLSEFFNENNLKFNIAKNGIEALNSVKKSIPDAIILDLMMPEMDGFELLEKIRANNKTTTIPVLILTAKQLNSKELKRLTSNNIFQLIQKGNISKEQLIESLSAMFIPLSEIKINKKKGRANILLVEDNPDNIKTVEVLLNDKHNIIIAKDGAEGIEKSKTAKPDIILMDISLPNVDGYQAFTEIRKNKSLKNIPIIALTARAMKGDREELLEYGFDDYISKPVDITYFEKILSKWLEI